MNEVFMDAAVAARPNRAYFFIYDQYVVYDYAAVPERVVDGVHAIDTFPPNGLAGFPADLAPGRSGRDRRVRAALQGKGPYAGALYFFCGSNYVRFDQGSGFAAAGARDTASAWGLPAPVNEPDAAFSGGRNRKAYCYFFKGDRYWRYLWNGDRVDDNYPRAVSSLRNMPAFMSGGVDCAVDGPGSPTSDDFDASYLFRGDKYVRFNWVNDGQGEPGCDALRATAEAWPGLLELLAAARAKADAQALLPRALQLTAQRSAGALAGAELALVNTALQVHFKAQDVATAAAVAAGISAIIATLNASGTLFRFRNLDEARADGNVVAPKMPHAAYAYAVGSHLAYPAGAIMFSPMFLARTPENRVLSVVHEAVHVFDAASGADANHIPEWYVSPGARAGLGLPVIINIEPPVPPTFYDTQPAAAALHNPAAFAAYVRHVATGSDVRALP